MTKYHADGLTIVAEEDVWQLTSDRSAGGTLLLEARQHAADVRFHPEFGRARQLRVDQALSVGSVAEVVVGWSPSECAWHLGLVLSGDLVSERGGRWCALARWGNDAVGRIEAREAGEQLARVLGKPFRFIGVPGGSPQESRKPVTEDREAGLEEVASNQEMAAAPIAVLQSEQAVTHTEAVTAFESVPQTAIESPELPLRMGNWFLRQIDIGYQWEHGSVWSWAVLLNVLGRIVLGIAFVVVSILTLQSPYAQVQPWLLPYAGVIIGLGLIGAALVYLLRQLRMEAVVFDTEERQVRRHLDLTSDVVASYEFDEIAAIVVTQIAQGGRQRGRNGQRDRMAHEAWMHLLLHAPRTEHDKARNFKPEDAYVTIGYIDLTDGEMVDAHFEGKRHAQQPRLLLPGEATTPVLQAATLLAEAIGVRAYIDQR